MLGGDGQASVENLRKGNLERNTGCFLRGTQGAAMKLSWAMSASR